MAWRLNPNIVTLERDTNGFIVTKLNHAIGQPTTIRYSQVMGVQFKEYKEKGNEEDGEGKLIIKIVFCLKVDLLSKSDYLRR